MRPEDFEEHFGTVISDDELADIVATRQPTNPAKPKLQLLNYYGSAVVEPWDLPDYEPTTPFTQTINSRVSSVRSFWSGRSLSQRSILARNSIFDQMLHARSYDVDKMRIRRKDEEEYMVRASISGLIAQINGIEEAASRQNRRHLELSRRVRANVAKYFSTGQSTQN